MEFFLALVKEPANIKKQRELYCRLFQQYSQYLGLDCDIEFDLLSCSEFLSEKFPSLLPNMLSIIDYIKKKFIDYSNIVDDPYNVKKNNIFNFYKFIFKETCTCTAEEYTEKIITFLKNLVKVLFD